MKHKKLSHFVAVSLALIGSTAQANIVFNLVNPDVCSTLQGTWNGKGTVTALGGLLSCVYTGTADVSQGQSAKDFNMSIYLNKQSGSKACPPTESLTLPGTCENGMLNIDSTDMANLNGTVDNTGKNANLTGTVTFEAPPLGKVTAKVKEMVLHKIS